MYRVHGEVKIQSSAMQLLLWRILRKTSAVPELVEMLRNDHRPVMRGTIAWALGENWDR